MYAQVNLNCARLCVEQESLKFEEIVNSKMVVVVNIKNKFFLK